ncbi:MAG: hypothetical protein HQL07_04645 [Nitrospirae bacterium]|nr:hypothetical protein [Magnetococcales bacterium]HAT50778.1 hypothetical protein [Alphaproteobacteria bacterium]
MLKHVTERDLINSRNLFTVGLGQVGFAISQAMNHAAKECGLSREQIVDRMNEVAAQLNINITSGNSKTLTLTTLDKWLNPNERHKPNFEAFVLFCQVTASLEPINAMGGPLGGVMITTYRAKILEMAEGELAIKMLRKKNRELRKQVTTK